MRQKGRPYLFSNSVSPSVVGASVEVFKMLKESQDLISNLRSNTDLFRQGMKKAGFNILGNDDCPIAPVYLGDAKLAGEMSSILMEKYSVYVIGFSYPVVPKGQARIRV